MKAVWLKLKSFGANYQLLQGFAGTPRSMFREAESAFEPMPDDFGSNPADLATMLTTAPISIDELIRQSGASPAAVQLTLLELELAGRLCGPCLRGPAGLRRPRRLSVVLARHRPRRTPDCRDLRCGPGRRCHCHAGRRTDFSDTRVI